MSKTMPALFVGHGSPFNIFQENPFTNSLRTLSSNLPEPKAIVIISAHWVTQGTQLTLIDNPKMIYDYYGFPSKFYEYIYPAKGNRQISEEILNFLPNIIKSSLNWGIDHAATIILENLFPKANIPVIELSLDYWKPPEYHFDLGRKLRLLRENGIMFIGSGNLIHTFREVDWENQYGVPRSWAVEIDTLHKQSISNYDFKSLIHYDQWVLSTRAFQTNEHYLPMLYILGMKDTKDTLGYIYEGFQHGTISHRSFIYR
ncbi:MAG: 4,5-DOPA-extradiol-dioxygenase [Promethearchaeota archaeon]|jgi:4,5-DOPA dioxygenase extradiol